MNFRSAFLSVLIGALAFSAPARAQGELRMTLVATPPALGNPYGGIGIPAAMVWDALFDPLVGPDEAGKLRPVLALRWETVAPTRWRFHLRPGVRFSNGEPFDSAAVVSALNWLASPDGRRSVIGAEVLSLAGAEAVDAMTVDVLTDKPDAILPKRLAPVAMVAPKAWANGIDDFAQKPAGTGPFVLETWQNTSGRVVLRANKDSWRPPKLDSITFAVTADPVVRAQLLLSEQIDVANVMSPDTLTQFEGTPFQIVQSPTPQVYSLAFNAVGRPDSPIAEVRVRQALNYGVDKETLVNVMMQGRMKVASQGATPMTFGYNPKLAPYAYDPARARSLLAEAGVKGRLALRAEIVLNGLPADAGFLELIQHDLRAIGVDLEIRTVPFADWLRKYTSGTFEVEMFGLSWNGAPSYDAIRAAEYFSCAKPNPFYCNRALDPLFAAAQVEFDPARRAEILMNLTEKLRNEAAALFLFEVADLAVVSPAVSNYRVRTRVPIYEDIELRRP